MARPSLDTIQIIKIQAIIKSWASNKLTWDLLVLRIKNDMGITTTRQTLVTYDAIKHEYDQKKDQLRGRPSLPMEAAKYLSKKEKVLITALVERDSKIKKLNAEIESYEVKNGQLQTFIKILAEKATRNPLLIDILQRTRIEVLKK